jgi:hypothetical protein
MAPKAPRSTATGSPQSGGPGVRTSLTPKRQREASDIAAFMGRQLRALRRRAASGDLEAMRAFVSVQVALKVEMRLAALALHYQADYSWTEIGWAAGITKQSPQERWGS